MGEILLEWARNIIFFMVFLSVISHLLADASYEKYIRFFAGIVLILITVSPLKGGLDFQEKAGRFFEEFSFFQEKEQAGKALSKADQERMGAFLAEYKKEAEARIQVEIFQSPSRKILYGLSRSSGDWTLSWHNVVTFRLSTGLVLTHFI